MKQFDTLSTPSLKPKKETVAFLLAYSKNLVSMKTQKRKMVFTVSKN